MPLSSFRTEIARYRNYSHKKKEVEKLDVPWVLTSRTDATRKHEIKLLGFTNFVTSIRITNIMYTTELSKSWPREIIQLEISTYESDL